MAITTSGSRQTKMECCEAERHKDGQKQLRILHIMTHVDKWWLEDMQGVLFLRPTPDGVTSYLRPMNSCACCWAKDTGGTNTNFGSVRCHWQLSQAGQYEPEAVKRFSNRSKQLHESESQCALYRAGPAASAADGCPCRQPMAGPPPVQQITNHPTRMGTESAF